MTALSRDEARRVYDRIGSRQDTQAFYEDRATDILVRNGAFGAARRILELGCGTGRFAFRLLATQLSDVAHYKALDLSPVMVALARERLAPFGSRVEVVLTDGSPPRAEPTASCDRFVSNFVLDLLAEDDIASVIHEAHRIVEPGGLLCLSSLSTGSGPFSRLVARAWSWVHAARPALVGGCRPLALLTWLEPAQWRVRHHQTLVPFGVPSEVLVAERR